MKLGKAAKTYALATQGIITMVMMLGLGFFIGYKIDPNSIWPGLLAGIGVLVGVFIFVSYLLYLIKGEEKKNGPKHKD